MLPDDAYAEVVRGTLLGDHPVLERGDGADGPAFLVDRITDVRRTVGDDGFDDLTVDHERVARRPFGRWRSLAPSTTSVLFDAQWRRDDGWGDPASYAAMVLAQVRRTSAGAPSDRRPRARVRAWFRPAELPTPVPSAHALWPAVLTELGARYADVHVVRPGVVELVDAGAPASETPSPVRVLITSEQLRRLAAAGQARVAELREPTGRGGLEPPALPGPVDGTADEIETVTAGARRRGEPYVVFFRDALHGSVRAALPPVRGRAVRAR